jgi:hypothetical protein
MTVRGTDPKKWSPRAQEFCEANYKRVLAPAGGSYRGRRALGKNAGVRPEAEPFLSDFQRRPSSLAEALPSRSPRSSLLSFSKLFVKTKGIELTGLVSPLF